MEVRVNKIGRVFTCHLTQGEEILAEISNLARKYQIKGASFFVLGAIGEGKITTGFIRDREKDSKPIQDLGLKREVLGIGSLSWSAKKPEAIREAVPWEGPQPYPHLHLVFGPDVGVEEKEILVGHLQKGLASGVTVLLYEHLE